MGACQDSETHAFHVSWLDTSIAGSNDAGRAHARRAATRAALAIAATFGFFDEAPTGPARAIVAEVIDGAGNHRLLFTGTGRSSGNVGLDKLAVTSLAAGLAPASMNDWGPVGGGSGSDSQLLPNNYTTADTTSTFMVSTSSNVASAGSGAVVVVAGFPADQKLLAWTVTPARRIHGRRGTDAVDGVRRRHRCARRCEPVGRQRAVGRRVARSTARTTSRRRRASTSRRLIRRAPSSSTRRPSRPRAPPRGTR